MTGQGPAHTLRCPVCGKPLEARCADHPEPFLAYDPMIGLLAYAPVSVEKQVLHEAKVDGFRALHLYFPETNSDHLVILPTAEGKLHPLCREQFEAHRKAQEEWAEHCADCCMEYCGGSEAMGSELCLCDCDAYCGDAVWLDEYDDPGSGELYDESMWEEV